MKILHLTEHFFPFLGGTEMFVYELSKRLVKDGFDVEIICERERNTEQYEVMEGIKIHRIFGGRLIKLKYDVGRIAPKMLISAIKNDADIVHAHSYSYFPTWASILSHKPTVITTQSDPLAKIYPVSDLFRSIPIKLCDRVVATTEMEKNHLIKRGVNARNISVIPNGVTLPPMYTHSIKFSNTILCLARLDIAHKGQDILLEAMPKVLSEIPDAKLWIAGEGYGLESLQMLAKKLGIDRNVEFKGPVYGAAKASCFEKCNLLCVAPRTESFGIIYLESMAYGLPIVTTRVGGIPEVVGNIALLVPPNDHSALADAIIKVLTDKNLADNMRKKGLERVKQFNWDLLVKKYENIYKQMVMRRV